MNVDWFQPFSHIEYSVGAIYLTVQNLPRIARYKEEYIILIGIIPGPTEPSLSLNSYLTPLVQELQMGWTSGLMVHDKYGTVVKVRVALSCVACDIPASRKVSGFCFIMQQKVVTNVLKHLKLLHKGRLIIQDLITIIGYCVT